VARFKNYLLVVIGFALAGLIGAAFGTGTAQAVVATLVEVVNPTTSPVPSLNVDDPGRIAYQSEIDMNGKCSGAGCSFDSPVVPAGHRVVVQHISGSISYVSAPTVITVDAFAGTTSHLADFYAPIPPGLLFSQFDQPALFYVDSGQVATVFVALWGNLSMFVTAADIVQAVTLTGYELDCTVANCAAIATQ